MKQHQPFMTNSTRAACYPQTYTRFVRFSYSNRIMCMFCDYLYWMDSNYCDTNVFRTLGLLHCIYASHPPPRMKNDAIVSPVEFFFFIHLKQFIRVLNLFFIFFSHKNIFSRSIRLNRGQFVEFNLMSSCKISQIDFLPFLSDLLSSLRSTNAKLTVN